MATLRAGGVSIRTRTVPQSRRAGNQVGEEEDTALMSAARDEFASVNRRGGDMRKVLKTAWLIVFVASLAFAGGGPNWMRDVKKELAAEGKVMAHCISWGRRLYTAATPEQIAKCPVWDGQSEPPLSLTKAISSARDCVQRDNPTFGPLEPRDIRLQKGHSGKWIYTIYLDGDAPHDGGSARAEFVVNVLMDGTILKRCYGDAPRRVAKQLVREKPEVTRNGKSLPVAETDRHAIERRMSEIIIPEVDFRQANIRDVITFLDGMVSKYGAELETHDDSRVRVAIGRHFTLAERRAFLPPHAIHWSGTPDEPLLTFAARDISLLEALGIVVSVGEMEYSIRGQEVSIDDPKKF
jgi:hypothetical protein